MNWTTWLKALPISLAAVATLLAAAQAQPTAGKGVNYLTGQGMDALNCQAAGTHQIARDMAKLKPMNLQWVRIETAQTAITGLPNPPSCPPPAHEFDNVKNMLQGVASIGAQPVLDILGWHYPPGLANSYKAWLARLLAALPQMQTFEIGNEENLNYKTESGKGSDPNNQPYGWDVSKKIFAGNDPYGRCAAGSKQERQITPAVTTFVTWLQDSARLIKAANPNATIIISGLSSYQSDCWLSVMEELGAPKMADALGYHPYPRQVGPHSGANTILDIDTIMSGWPKKLPVWVTEYGFSSNGYDFNPVPQSTKARFLAEQFTLMDGQVAGPIIMYTARDYPLTTVQWQAQCADRCPNGIGGFGLFEWRDGQYIPEPSAKVYGGLKRH